VRDAVEKLQQATKEYVSEPRKRTKTKLDSIHDVLQKKRKREEESEKRQKAKEVRVKADREGPLEGRRKRQRPVSADGAEGTQDTQWKKKMKKNGSAELAGPNKGQVRKTHTGTMSCAPQKEPKGPVKKLKHK
jgi:hypothetical protein